MARPLTFIYKALPIIAANLGYQSIHTIFRKNFVDLKLLIEPEALQNKLLFISESNYNTDGLSLFSNKHNSNNRLLIIDNHQLLGIGNEIQEYLVNIPPGNLIILVIEDLLNNYSTNITDARQFGKLLQLPVLEPSNTQETLDSFLFANEIANVTRRPVLIRIAHHLFTSETSLFYTLHNKDVLQNQTSDNAKLPGEILSNTLIQLSAQSDLNRFILGSNRRMGILCCGITFTPTMEIKEMYDMEFPLLKIGQYPLPKKLMHKLFTECREVLILEEGYPLYEEWIRGYFDNEQVKGRMDNCLPLNDCLNQENILKAILK